MTYTDQLRQLTSKYNEAVRALDDSYSVESTHSKGWNLTSSHLKKQYSKRYDALAREYRGKRNELFEAYKYEHPEWTKARRMWGWTFVIGVIMAMVCCTAAIPVEEEPEAAVLTTIGNSAFESCKRLTVVNIPNSVASIGKRAFANCGGLAVVDIPDSVEVIGKDAFLGCSNLKDVKAPKRFLPLKTK